MISPERQSARMSKITIDGLTRLMLVGCSYIGCVFRAFNTVDLAPRSTRIHSHSSPANVFLDRLGIGVPTGH